MISFLDAMIPKHVQDEMRKRVHPCPNQPPCEHSGLVHETDWDDPLPRCCADGCYCGAAPCKCHQSFASVTPTHPGHCCFVPASQTCHPAEVAEWERQNALRRPSSRIRNLPR